MQGDELLATLQSLGNPTAAAVVLRHAQRFPIIDPSEPTLAEITPAGAAAAEALGRRIAGVDRVRIFHSPVKRCRQTAECLAQGAAAAGLTVELAGPRNVLGVDYILDLDQAGRLSQLHGNDFVRLWFTGQLAEAIIRPAAQIAAEKLDYLTHCLQEPGGTGRRLDLHVSHDWNVIILREHMLQIRHEEAGWLTFLDGLTLVQRPAGLQAVYREHSRIQPLPWEFRAAG